MYQKVKPPCRQDCPRRTAECRLTCNRWAFYVAQRNEDYRQRQIRRDACSTSNIKDKYIKDKMDRQKRGRK